MNWDLVPVTVALVVAGVVHIVARRRLARWTHREWSRRFGPRAARTVGFWEKHRAVAGWVIIAAGVGALVVSQLVDA